MSFGESVLALLQHRGLRSHFRYADIQAMKAVTDATQMLALLSERGHGVEEARSEPLHFADLIEIQILKERLEGATVAVVLFGLT